LLNEAELENIWKALLSNDSVVKRAWDVSIYCSYVCSHLIISWNIRGHSPRGRERETDVIIQ